jgi:hypothetical protein
MRSFEAYSPNVVEVEFSEGLIAPVQHPCLWLRSWIFRDYRAFWARKRPMANTATQSMVA